MAFNTLPIELRRLILAELDSFSSLASAILTCRALHSAYLLKPSGAITASILVNQVGYDVLPEVTIALASSQLPPHSPEASDVFITTYLASRTIHQIPASLGAYSRLEELNSCVTSLAQWFADDCLGRLETSGDGSSNVAAPPTASEIARIKRALYRFEIFCNLYYRKSPSQPVSHDSLATFCLCFAPWENEQLGAILDFLFRIASPAFNDVAAHDITWGNLKIEPALFLSSISFQGVLSQGLVKIHAISTAQSYDDRYAQLSSDHFLARPDFLNRALRLTARSAVESASPLSAFSAEDREEYIRPPFFRDPDTGPSDAWEREHHDELSTGFVYQPHHHHLRELGYVMWDQARIDAMVPFPGPRRTQDVVGVTQEVSDTRWLASWMKRAAIFSRGGRGWWDFEDESRIVWPKEQQRIARMGGKDDTALPKSMGEAKRALLAMTLPSSSAALVSRQL
ncbi:unnamed protein product [Clonostachys rosea]|uniref:F-box domain-containing protein n=1 Tax=Bionectria ochroleuca TaxID=29856 RepID=A0ABY6U6Q8_BIOOC|nr:unnamed protein product [Clonostachys rosea]